MVLLEQTRYCLLIQTVDGIAISSAECFSFAKCELGCWGVACYRNKISAYHFNEGIRKEYSLKVDLDEGDQFRCISNAIQLSDCFVLVACTRFGEFFLVIIKRKGSVETSRMKVESEMEN